MNHSTTSRWNLAKTFQWYVSKTSLSNVVTVYHWYAFTTFQTSLGGTSPRRFRYTSPRCHTRSLTGTKLQHLKQISNETTNEVAVVGHHHVSELRCHEPLLIRLSTFSNYVAMTSNW